MFSLQFQQTCTYFLKNLRIWSTVQDTAPTRTFLAHTHSWLANGWIPQIGLLSLLGK